jgi:NADH-quinone oxidoreductase subunit A
LQFEFANILVFLALAAGFLVATLTIGRILRPHTPDARKNMIYECGEEPVAQAWFNFNPRFYIVAIIFLVFDVEVAFTWPVAAVFKRFVANGAGGLAYAELFAFIGILALGLAYVWQKGDLEWLRPKVEQTEEHRDTALARRREAEKALAGVQSVAPVPAAATAEARTATE